MQKLIVMFCAVALTAACNNTGSSTSVKTAIPGDSADQMMFGVRFYVTDNGVRRAHVKGDTAFTYEENTRTDLRNVHAVFFAQNGDSNAVLTSQRGVYHERLGTMEARGNVVLIASDGRKLTTPHLRYEPNRNEITSDSSFVLTEPNGRTSSGVGFVTDPDLNSIRILREAKSRGSQVTLPPR